MKDFRESLDNYRQLTAEEAQLMVMVSMNEATINDKELPDGIRTMGHEIIDKQVEHLNLPVTFTNAAYSILGIWCRNPGRSIMFLIDCLNNIPNSKEAYKTWKQNTLNKPVDPFTIDVDFLCREVYPYGVYNDNTLDTYKEKLREKTIPWSELY